MKNMRQPFIARVALKRHPGEICQFVGILARCWNRYRSRPVKVHMTQLVGQALKFVSVKTLSIVENVVRCWTHRALAGVLRD
jgi:hypothetical protein